MVTNNTKVDLHIHSCNSDGKDTIEQIIQQAIDKEIGLISLTDHDTCDNYNDFIQLAKESNIQCITGIEISCKDDIGLFEVLGYGINHNDINLKDFVKEIRQNRLIYDASKIKEMSKDISKIDYDEYKEWEYDKRLGLWKSVNYLIHKNIVSNLSEGMTLLKKYNFDYKDIEKPTIKEAVNQIHKANGYAVLAHIGVYLDKNSPKEEIKSMIEYIMNQDIDGFECYHPSNNKSQTEICKQWCEENNMLITGGSDYHSKLRSEIGSQNIIYSMLNLDRINII